jgi:hypothetical protein
VHHCFCTLHALIGVTAQLVVCLLQNIPVVFDASNVTLSNSTLTLYNSKLVLNAATVTLNNAEVMGNELTFAERLAA